MSVYQVSEVDFQSQIFKEIERKVITLKSLIKNQLAKNVDALDEQKIKIYENIPLSSRDFIESQILRPDLLQQSIQTV